MIKTPNKPGEIRPMLRAEGNLSYLQFIKMVQKVWSEAYPNIPIVPAGSGEIAKYPCIVYGLEMRQTHPGEPKTKYRETLYDDQDNAYAIDAQRFQNIIGFEVYAESETPESARVAEELIETFEEFMQEYIPLFKRHGVSELTYARRTPDSETNHRGGGFVTRKVTYLTTLERVVSTQVEKLEYIEAIINLYIDAKPVGFETDITDPAETTSFIKITSGSLKVGDSVNLWKHQDHPYPEGLDIGLFYITNLKEESNIRYFQLAHKEGDDYYPVEIGPGRGVLQIYHAAQDTFTTPIAPLEGSPI